MRIGLLLSLFIAPFFPLFFVLKNSTDDRSLIHRLIAVGFVVHWLFIPVNFTDEPLALKWVLAAASWILVHKTILWLLTDFQLFHNNIFRKYKYNSNRQIWEYLKSTLLCPLTGIPEEWIPDSDRKPIEVAKSTDADEKFKAKTWVLPKGGPSITINFVRFILCTLLGSLAREIPPSELDPSFFTITSIKTNFFLITFIYGYISTGWDLWFIFIRSVISTGTKLYIKRFPRSPLLRSNPQPDTTPFYLQDFLTIMTKYHSLFNNPYTFRSLKYFWAKQWHQVFSVAFVDCCYRKVHHPGCHPFRTFLALYTAFINSGILHEFLLCSTHGAASVSFEDFFFMSLQPPVLMIEYFVFKTVVARNKFLRAAFWLIEYYYLIGIMSLFWRPFIRNSTYQAQVFVFNVWRWEEHTATAHFIMHRHTRVVPLSVRDVFQPCSDRVRTYTTPGLRHRIMGRKVTSKLELKSVSEVLSDVRLDAGFQAAVDTARYYIEKYRTQRNSSKISQIGQWFLTFKDDKSKSEEILDVALSSSDALFELGNYEKSIDLAKEGYDLAQNATEEARTHSAHSLGRKCIRYGMSIHGSKPDAAARFLQESLNTILDQLSLLDKQSGETFQKSSLQICAGILFYYLEQSSLDPNFGLAINRFHLAEGLLAEAKDSANYSEEGINHLLKLLYYYRGKALQRMDASEKASDELLSALKYADLNESVDNLECPLYLAVEAPPNVSIHLELAYLYASQLRLNSALNHIQNWEASNQNFDLKSQVETLRRNITAIQRLNDESNHNDVRELYKLGNQLMVLSDFLSLDGDLNLHKIRNEAIRVFEKCKEMCRQRENQNAVDIRAINRKLGILLSDGSREDKCLALQYLSKDLNLSKSCSNDDEAKAYEKAYKLMIELDKSPDQAMKLLECLGDYYLNERSNAETAALWKSGLAYFRKKGDIARAKKCRAMIDEIPGAIDDLKLSDIDLDDFFSPMDVSENMEDVERSYVISIHGKTFTINVDATMAVADAIKLIQNEYQDRFGREPIIDELQTNKGVPLSAHSILARVVSANNQLSALSSGFTQVFAHELYQKECQKTDTKAMDQVTQCLRVGDETSRFLFRCLGLYSTQATAVITSISSSNIQELDLSKNLLNDSDLQYMCDIGMELDNLAKLGLSSNRFTLTGLLLFFNRYDCPKLEDIDISSTLLDDLNGWELFLSLAKYKELSKLIIEGTKLRIEDTRINYNESSTPLFPNLVHLSLSNNRNLKISESFVQTLTQACPNLEVLNLSRLLYIGNSISRLSALKRLKRLNCSWVKSWGSEKLKLQELLKQNGSLEILDVAYTNLDFDSFLHGLTLNYCLKEMRCIGIPLSNHDFESLIQVVDSNRDCKLMNISYGCFDGENEIDPDLTDRLHQALLNIIRKSG